MKHEGRIISISLDITLTPRDYSGELGDTDAAWDLGTEIVGDVMKLLAIVAENEGFDVSVNRRNVVY